MQLIQKDLLRTYTLEIIPTKIGQTNFTFPDIPFLRNKISYGIDTSINSSMATTGKINLFSQPSFVINPTTPGFLTMVDSQNNQFIQNMPLMELQSLQYQYFDSTPTIVNFPYNTNGTMIFSERIVQWNKCTLYFPASPISILTTGFQFTIYYK
jgi:hypothetical protein